MRLLSLWLFCLSTATNVYAQGSGNQGGVGPSSRPYNGGPVSSAYKAPNGTCALPSYTYTSDPDLGSYRIAANNEGFCAGTVAAFDYSDTRVNFALPVLFTGSSKNITWNTDGGGNIGAVGANRPDNGYFKTSVVVGNDTLTDGGAFVSFSGGVKGTRLLIGTDPDASAAVGVTGYARFTDGVFVSSGNTIGWPSLFAFRSSADGIVKFLDSTAGVGVSVDIKTDSTFFVKSVANTDVAIIKANTLSATGAFVDATGANPASAGTLRLRSGGSIRYRNAGNSSDRYAFLANGDDTFQLGDNGVPAIIMGAPLVTFGGDHLVGNPALKQGTGAELQVRTGTDSTYGAMTSLYVRSGSGTPEGNVTAPVGAIYHRTDGGAGTSFYVKESGSGNTGWVAK